MSYPGSKGQAGVFQRIIGQMPPHSLYVEAFAGSAQIFQRKRLAATNVLIDADAGVSARLGAAYGGRRDVEVVHGDAIQWLAESVFDDNSDAVIYCDPPYVLSTRQSRFYYNQEMSDGDHSTLLSALRTVKCRVLISGYPSELYSSQLQGWRCCRYRTRTRGRTVTECLWMNFPEPDELHDWRFAGQNFRQRTSLKRLAARYLARFERMPARKRGYVLNAIEQRQFGRVAPAAGAAHGSPRHF